MEVAMYLIVLNKNCLGLVFLFKVNTHLSIKGKEPIRFHVLECILHLNISIKPDQIQEETNRNSISWDLEVKKCHAEQMCHT